MTDPMPTARLCFALVLAAAVVAVACDGSHTPSDSGTGSDSGPMPAMDSGPATSTDAAGTPDASPRDAGARTSDSGSALQVAFTGPPVAVTHVRGSVTLQLVVLGGVPDQLELWKDGSILAVLTPPYSYTWDTDLETEGEHNLEARAVVGGSTAASSDRSFTVDRTPPTITSRSPAPDSAAALATPLRVEFSEPMSAASLAGALTVDVASGPLAVTLSEPDPNVLSAQVTDALSTLPATAMATVRGTVTDLAGNPLGADSTWSFTYPAWAPRTGSGVGTTPTLLDATLAADGTVWLLYGESGPDVRVAKYDATGWHDIPSPRTGARIIREGRVRIRSSGGVVVMWSGDADTTTVELRVSEWDGTAWTEYPAPLRSSESSASGVDMEVDAGDNVVISESNRPRLSGPALRRHMDPGRNHAVGHQHNRCEDHRPLSRARRALSLLRQQLHLLRSARGSWFLGIAGRALHGHLVDASVRWCSARSRSRRIVF